MLNYCNVSSEYGDYERTYCMAIHYYTVNTTIRLKLKLVISVKHHRIFMKCTVAHYALRNKAELNHTMQKNNNIKQCLITKKNKVNLEYRKALANHIRFHMVLLSILS